MKDRRAWTHVSGSRQFHGNLRQLSLCHCARLIQDLFARLQLSPRVDEALPFEAMAGVFWMGCIGVQVVGLGCRRGSGMCSQSICLLFDGSSKPASSRHALLPTCGNCVFSCAACHPVPKHSLATAALASNEPLSGVPQSSFYTSVGYALRYTRRWLSPAPRNSSSTWNRGHSAHASV